MYKSALSQYMLRVCAVLNMRAFEALKKVSNET